MKWCGQIGKADFFGDSIIIENEELKKAVKSFVGKPVKYNGVVIAKVIYASWNDGTKVIDFEAETI